MIFLPAFTFLAMLGNQYICSRLFVVLMSLYHVLQILLSFKFLNFSFLVYLSATYFVPFKTIKESNT